MNKKYELLPSKFPNLFRIRALRHFSDVKAGDLGGLIAEEKNLSHEGNCWVYENAQVYGSALVFGSARVYDKARINKNIYISYGKIKETSINTLLAASCNLGVVNGKVIAYKSVISTKNPNLFVSEFDTGFYYVVGEYSVCENPEENDTISCGAGIHCSNLNYWTFKSSICDSYIMVEIDVKDIICVLEGKIRCRKVKTLGKVDV